MNVNILYPFGGTKSIVLTLTNDVLENPMRPICDFIG
jgi:hypothetical protein